MGHAYPTNISKRFKKMLGQNDAISLAEVAAECQKRKEWLSCAEGVYDESCMIRMALMEIAGRYIEHGLIKPKRISIAQQQILDEFNDVAESGRDISDWDCGDDGNGGEYGVFDSIMWTKTKKGKRGLPVVGYICN